MSDVSEVLSQRQFQPVNAPPEKIPRFVAENMIYSMLSGIVHLLSAPTINRLSEQERTIFGDFESLSKMYCSEIFKETVWVLKHEEFMDFFHFVVNAAMATGYMSPAFREVEIIPHSVSGEVNAPIILLTFLRKKNKLTVTHINTGHDQSKYVEYNASNNIVTDETPENRNTRLENGDKGSNYFPQPFPAGFWKVREIITGDPTWEGPYKLRTDAHQLVDVYALVEDKATDTSVWVNAGQEDDWGYNIHSGGSSWESNTEGCIRATKETIDDLKLLFDNKGTNGRMYLSVEGNW